MKNATIILFLFIANLAKIHAQFVYPNDICSGARPLPVSNTGQLSDSAFQRNDYANPAASAIPTCEGDLPSTANDLWYSFIALDTKYWVEN